MKNQIIKKEFQILSYIKDREEAKKRMADSFPQVNEEDKRLYAECTLMLKEFERMGDIPKADFLYYSNLIGRNLYTKE